MQQRFRNMLEIFVLTVCLKAWGCDATASAYYAYNKDLQTSLKNAERLVQERSNTVALTAANFALNYYRNNEVRLPIAPNTVLIYTPTSTNMQFGRSF